MTLLVYLLKVIVVSAILFGYYRLFLRNKRFHHYNRFFLLSALLLSIVLPFIRIPLLYQPENPVNDAVYRTVSVINTDYNGIDEVAAPVEESAFTLINSIYLLYAIGVLFLLTLVVKSLLYIRSLRKRYPAEEITSLRFYNTHEPGTPFSFFRSVFWNDQLNFNSHEGQQIFRHELFHVQHRHSADRLLAEVLTALFWFNPFFHLIKKELKAIHEFLADQFAISDSDRYAYATLLVQQALEQGKHQVTNHFFQNHIKRRIAMITQFKKSNYGYWSRVMVLPLSILLFCFVTLYAEKPAADPLTKNVAGVTPPFNNLNDTIPGKDTVLMKKIEQLKHMEQLKKKMVEEDILMKKMQRLELEVLKKQMVEQELLMKENSKDKEGHEAEMLTLKKNLENRRNEMDILRKAQSAEIQKLQKEYEQDAGENELAKKLYREKLDEARKEIQVMHDKMRKEQLDREIMLKDKIRELERSHDKFAGEKMKYDEIKKFKQKIIEQENELKKRHQEQIDLHKGELKKREQEIKNLEQKLKNEDQGSSKFFRQDDSLVHIVMRHYNRRLRYPQPAIDKGAEDSVYFSVFADKDGSFSEFTTYDHPPAGKPVRELVIIGYRNSLAAPAEEMANSEKKTIFTEQVKQATSGFRNSALQYSKDRVYYFKAKFLLEPKKKNQPLTYLEGSNDKDLSYSLQTRYETPGSSSSSISYFSSSSSSFSSSDQDTIPDKRAEKARVANRDRRVAKPRVKAEAKAEAKADAKAESRVQKESRKESETRKLFKSSRKIEFNRKETSKLQKPGRKLFADKKPSLFKTKPAKPKEPKDKIKIKPKKAGGSGQISDQEESDDNYSSTSLTDK